MEARAVSRICRRRPGGVLALLLPSFHFALHVAVKPAHPRPICGDMNTRQLILAALFLATLPGGALAISPDSAQETAAPGADSPPLALGFITLPPLLFDTDADTLDDAALERLEDVALFLRRHPRATRLLVRGHADIVAGDDYNEKLALRRAEAVRARLLELGVPARLLHIDARGRGEPVDHNDTGSGRARNRRVEMYVLVKD